MSTAKGRVRYDFYCFWFSFVRSREDWRGFDWNNRRAMMKMRVDWKVEHVVLMSQFIVNFFLILFRVVSNVNRRQKLSTLMIRKKETWANFLPISRSCRAVSSDETKDVSVWCDRRFFIAFFIAASHFPTPSKGFKLNWKSLVRGISPGTDSVFLKSLSLCIYFRLPGGWRLELLLSFLPKMAIKRHATGEGDPKYTTSWLQQRISSLD